MKIRRLIVLFLLTSILSFGQNLKTQGKKIIDGNGSEVILRGMGLGGWMLMEGYMMQSSDVANTQHKFKERMIELVGTEKTDEFFNAWLENHVTKADIDSLATWGFNSVRLPMHYNLYTLPIEDEPVSGQQTWLDKGFELTDQLLDWCEENSIYLILDLHAAPGGQGTDEAISDYDPSKPSLWESQDNKDKTVALWKKLAERYKDEPWIGGYDLLNEVNDFGNKFNIGPNNIQLKNLYVEITNAIREVDENHIIFIEGNGYANDHAGLTPPWDDNLVYSFHKYWNPNGPGDLDWILNLQEQHNVPLWMGEGGENSNVWFNEAVTLLESKGIGWAWWPMKRIETIVGPYHIKFTEGYKNVLKYWRGEIAKPSVNDAYDWMMELANNTNSENCIYNRDVPDALIRQTYSDDTKPFKYHTIPGLIHLTDFDLGKIKFAYDDYEFANYGDGAAWNAGWMYRNDGVDIRISPDEVKTNGFYVGYTHRGEWMNYTVNIDETAIYKANMRVASIYSGGQFSLQIDGEEVVGVQKVTATGGWETFETMEIPDIVLSEGQHTLTFYIDNDIEFNMGSLEFVKTGNADAITFKEVSGHTHSDRKSIAFVVSKDVKASSLGTDISQFTLTVNGEEEAISGLSLSESGDRTIILSTNKQLNYTQEIKLSYSGTSIQSTSNETLGSFTDLEIRNTLTKTFLIPQKIEAEDFSVNNGFGVDNISEGSDNKYIGWTDQGDYADYEVFSNDAGNYQVKFNATANWDGEVGLYRINENGTESELMTLTVANTGGWNSYQVISGNIVLPKGYSTIRLKVLQDGFNVDWIEFILTGVISDDDIDNDGILNDDDDCPNTADGATVDANGCAIFTLPPDNFEIEVTSEGCVGEGNGKISVTAVDQTITYKISINGLVPQSFSTGISFPNLDPNDYEICITVDGEDFEQCYTIKVNAGTPLAAKASVKSKKATVELLQGTAPFSVYINGHQILETYASSFAIDVVHGDLLIVKSAVVCEGEFSKSIELFEDVTAYPNPTRGPFEIAIPGPRTEVVVDLFNVQMQLLSSKTYPVRNGKAQLDLSSAPIGVYIAKVHLAKTVSLKIIKQ